MKKVFGGINLTWPKIIIMAIIMGVYTAVMAMLPITSDTSFSDLAVTFEVWIFFGIFIIMNSKSAKDSALKCFIFFLISQPLVYLVQDVINHSNLFITYYRFWVSWTIGCIPMGFIGYYMKKDKWWGLLILTPILLLLGTSLGTYLSNTMFSFPRHILTVIFCISTLIIYPIAIFKDKKIKLVGIIISSLIIVGMIIWNILHPPVYSAEILSDSEFLHFDDSYKVYFTDSKYGDLSIINEEATKTWMIHADMKKSGETEFILEGPNGNKKTFDINIKMNSYEVNEK